MSDGQESRIVMTSISGCRNRGVEALVDASLHGFARIDPSAAFTLLSTDSDYDSWVFAKRAKVLPDAARIFRGGISSRFAVGLSHVHPRVGAKYRNVVEEFQNADLVVATGGDVFSSDYGPSLLRRSLAMLEAAQKQDAPIVFLAQSIGPFKTSKELADWRRVASKAALVTVREAASFDYVVQKAGVPPERVHLTADPAFTLPPASDNRIEELWGFLGLRDDVSTVAIAPSRGITAFSGIDSRAHLARWLEVIHFITHELGLQVLLIPHVHDTRLMNDDRILATELADGSHLHPLLHVAHGELRANDFKGLIGRCEMVIGERMHACIAGLSSGLCTVAVGYSIKSIGIMEQLLGKEVMEEGLLMSVEDFVHSNNTVSALATAWKNRELVSKRIQLQLPHVQRAADSTFEMALAVRR